MTDDDVQLLRNKKLLEDIRNSKGKAHDGESTGLSNGHVESGRGGSSPDASRDQGTLGRDTRGPERASESAGTTERPGSGVRPPVRKGVHTDKSTSDGDRQPQGIDAGKRFDFKLKSPFAKKEPAKLFTIAEVDATKERMIQIYYRGSGLLDDVLEIVVKDHEPVQIWQLDLEESTVLAEMHLSRARTDERAAASARQLLAFYDRLYIYLLAVPRIKNTVTHVQIHGGLSFR